jgi:hypothetical protein
MHEGNHDRNADYIGLIGSKRRRISFSIVCVMRARMKSV